MKYLPIRRQWKKSVQLIQLVGAFAFVAFILVIVNTWHAQAQLVEEEVEDVVTTQETSVPLESSDSFSLTLSGVAQAQQQIEVRAKVSGVVSSLPVGAGMKVAAGTLLYQQAQPVAVAQVAAADAAGVLAELQANREVEIAVLQASQASLQTITSQEVAQLQSLQDERSISLQTARVSTTLEETVQSLLEGFLYVENERQLFTLRQQEEYQRIVQELYGTLPNYLVGRFRYPVTETADLLAALQSESLTAVDVARLATVLDVQVSELLRLFQAVEGEVLDTTRGEVSVVRTERYLAARRALLETQAALRAQTQGLWREVDMAAQTAAQRSGTVAVTEVDEELAQQIARWQEQIADATVIQSDAEQAVANAQLALGQGVSPWAAVVEQVYVDPGAYVAAGEPIARLRSQHGVEVQAIVPIIGTDTLASGQVVEQEGVPIGVIDRVVTEPALGRRVAYITVTDPNVQLGTVVRAEVILPIPENHAVVSRAQLQFTNEGVFVALPEGRTAVTVVRDRGDTLLVRSIH